MKYALLVLVLSFSALGYSQPEVVSEVLINQEVLGGDVLMIRMQEALIITGKESQALQSELGVEGKKNFTRDLVMEKSPEELAAAYGNQTKRRVVHSVLNRYIALKQKLDSKPSLN